MRNIFGFGLIAASVAFFALPASADVWNLDFDTAAVDSDGNAISFFAGDTIFSHPTNGDWQRYDGNGVSSGNNPADTGIAGSNGVTVSIDVYNASSIRYDGSYSGYKHGYAVGFDTRNMASRDNDLEAPFYSSDGSDTDGYGNILIIQSHERSYTRNCGGGLTTSGVCFSESHQTSKSDDEAAGGDIVFDFGEEVTLLKMNVFDIEERGGKVKFDTDGDGYYDESVDIARTVHNQGYWGNADNGVGLLTFNGDIGIKAHKMMVWLAGSGGIDNIMGNTETTSSVSEPGVLALFGVGLLAIGVYRRRREVAAPNA